MVCIACIPNVNHLGSRRHCDVMACYLHGNKCVFVLFFHTFYGFQDANFSQARRLEKKTKKKNIASQQKAFVFRWVKILHLLFSGHSNLLVQRKTNLFHSKLIWIFYNIQLQFSPSPQPVTVKWNHGTKWQFDVWSDQKAKMQLFLQASPFDFCPIPHNLDLPLIMPTGKLNFLMWVLQVRSREKRSEEESRRG